MGRVYNAMVKAGTWRNAATESSPWGSAAAPGEVRPLPVIPRFQEPRQLLHLTGMQVDQHLAALTGSDPIATERFHTLAVRLTNMGLKRKLRSLLVTSARPGEGKTTVALNLAWVMSSPTERRVLLVDGDLRSPSVTTMLGLSARRGWIDLICGGSDLADVALRIDPARLYVLPGNRLIEAGDTPSPPRVAPPAELLTSSRVEQLIARLEQQFDFIIIDAPSINAFAEAQRLASIVDATMLVVEAGRTPHSAVTNALKLVPKERRAGIVLNQGDAT